MRDVFIKKMVEGMQPRFPQGPIEGAIKGTLVGGTLLVVYDLMKESGTLQEARAKSQLIVAGYIIFFSLGIMLGAIRWAKGMLFPQPTLRRE